MLGHDTKLHAWQVPLTSWYLDKQSEQAHVDSLIFHDKISILNQVLLITVHVIGFVLLFLVIDPDCINETTKKMIHNIIKEYDGTVFVQKSLVSWFLIGILIIKDKK